MSMYFDARRDHLRGSILKSSRLPAFMCHLFSIDAGSQELRCAPRLSCKPSPLELADPKRHGGTCPPACTKPQSGYISLIVARSLRDDRIDELERENIELRAKIREQQAVIETQQKTIAVLEQRIEQLEARRRGLEAILARHSGNSSCPPSSDPPGAPPPAPPKRTGRRRGGQPGHAKHSRHRVPPERVNQTIVVRPEVCRRCGDALHGDDPAPHRHQVIEVPKVMATVDEYQLHVLGCPKCGKGRRLPDQGRRRPMPRDPGAFARALDLRLCRWGRADEQCWRTPNSARRPMAQDELRHRQSERQPLRGAHSHGRDHAADAEAQCARLRDGRV
ncbi:uncharacterized protein SOCEGT47_018890 [Sorangium cellulosum]|uniref:DUF6444 domain-containing protein n=1 Tax=Sorangium cellulosum TaxID=56 RepID=A0A4P2PX14_SORCE|nr:uncharacterized protein SOCEGT47_018890 [Sorangium cellulosum]